VDLVFTTTRAPMTADDLLAHPVFGQTPAAKAGQIASWNDTHQLSYQGLTAALDGAREAVAGATVIA
jgi:ABC-type hemin transport system substrate-binding protein